MLCPAFRGAICYIEQLHTLGKSNFSVSRVEQSLHRMLERLLLLPPAFHLLIVVPLSHYLQIMPEDMDLHIL